MEDTTFFHLSTRSETCRRRRCQRRKLRKRRTMEGIRLRSDSDGSTKNAFYQGTIVSDSHQSISSLEVINQGAISSFRRKRIPSQKYSSLGDKERDKGFKNIHPPLPRRSFRNSSLGSKNDRYRLVSPDNSWHGQDEEPILDLSIPASDEGRDSLRYSTRSIFSTVSQQQVLLGTNFLNDDGSLDDPGIIDLGASLPQEQGLRKVQAWPGLASAERSSSTSVSSGVYFHQPAPPGPIHPSTVLKSGITQSRDPDSVKTYPIQQPSSIGYLSYGSSSGVKSKNQQVSHKSAPTIQENDEDSEESDEYTPLSERIMDWVDISAWLSKDVSFDDEGVPFFETTTTWTLAGMIRLLFFNPFFVEFTSLQQFSWACVIGIVMGCFTAGWKLLIEACVEFTWKTVPEHFLQWGFFTDLDGSFPLYYYVVLVPGFLGAVLSYINAAMPTPIPTQDSWIHTLHSRGVQECDTFIPTFVISTIGMSSGLSLGPELPLVLTAGMAGSWLAVLCRQSMLQARVLNLTAASAAIGGFFGFPMAGALFVLELPHRMGLQYFEALSPATIASIVAVLVNRMVLNNDITGVFEYPFLNDSLPSYIFKDAIVYGLFGGAIGILYTFCVKWTKSCVHHLFDFCDHHPSRSEATSDDRDLVEESTPLVDNANSSECKTRSRTHNCCFFFQFFSGLIPHKPTRAGLTGALVGIIVGCISIFLPHCLFWGEAQLQTLIDKGRTPLPVFGQDGDPTAALVALALCMPDQNRSEVGYSLQCSVAIVVAKTVVTGLSLGTGIVGGHFWAPLVVGCVSSHFFIDVMTFLSTSLGIPFSLSSYPCVALLCIMGSCHVVTFRSHMGIILILTLTIDAFVSEDSRLKVAGDFSAVFPLLTVAVFVALQISRQTVFYEKQRSRGDIQALPEALCEPGKEGKPWVMDYDGKLHALDESDYEYDETESDNDSDTSMGNTDDVGDFGNSMSQDDIEANFQAKIKSKPPPPPPQTFAKLTLNPELKDTAARISPIDPLIEYPLLESPSDLNTTNNASLTSEKELHKEEKLKKKMKLKTLDELLNGPIQSPSTRERKTVLDKKTRKKTHRRTQSEPFLMEDAEQRIEIMWNSSLTIPNTLRRPTLKRIDSYGEIDQGQPSLMDQVRLRAASVAKAESSMK